MPTISLCMIVKNEEKTLARCLSSVCGAVDEIIIVDTGSTDKTKDVARNYTEKIYDFAWTDDFSAARNYSFSFATCDYVMWLDADDILKADDAFKLSELKKLLASEDVGTAYVQYRTSPSFHYYRERIFKRALNPVWKEPVHEAVSPVGKSVFCDFEITHAKETENKPGRNLKIFQNYVKSGGVLSPRMKYYYAREMMFCGKTKQAVKMFETFLNDKDAWVENQIGACQDLASCYQRLGDGEKRLKALFKSFEYDIPRPKTCCLIAEYFFERGRRAESVYWYEAALTSAGLMSGTTANRKLGFVESEYYNFIPFIQLCVLHWQAGDREKAVYYNNLAGQFNENHPSYVSNKAFFEKLL